MESCSLNPWVGRTDPAGNRRTRWMAAAPKGVQNPAYRPAFFIVEGYLHTLLIRSLTSGVHSWYKEVRLLRLSANGTLLTNPRHTHRKLPRKAPAKANDRGFSPRRACRALGRRKPAPRKIWRDREGKLEPSGTKAKNTVGLEREKMGRRAKQVHSLFGRTPSRSFLLIFCWLGIILHGHGSP